MTIDAILAGEDDLLFHGTSEAFDLPPRPGPYDDVLWTAKDPRIAQSYIPRSGMSLVAWKPSTFDLGRPVKPSPNDFWHTVAKNMGLPPADVELDPHGRLLSWALPEGWPSYADAMQWLHGMGYDLDDRGCRISAVMENGAEIIKEASWSLPGRLLVASGAGLRFYDHAGDRDGDLVDLEYHDIELFRRVEAQGYDGIVINDFLQDEQHGNVGHRSHGLFATTASRLDWIEIPAVHLPWDRSRASTPEFDSFKESMTTMEPNR